MEAIRRAALAAVCLAASLASASTVTTESAIPPPPQAPRGADADTYHGVKVADPYRGLEDPDSTATRGWVEKQNERTAAYFRGTEYEALRAQLTRIWDYPRMQVPSQEGGAYYYERTSGLENQSPIYRRQTLDGAEELILDPNKLSDDGTVAVTGWAVSEDGRYFAYLVSEGGSDWNEARVLDLHTSKTLDDHLKWLKFTGIAWTHDGKGFFYGRYPEPAGGDESKLTETNYDFEVRYHRLGTPQSEDSLVYKTPEDRELGFWPIVTDDGRYLVISVWRGTEPKTGIAYADLKQGIPSQKDIRILLPHGKKDYNFVGNEGAEFFVRTDDGAPRHRVIAVSLDDPKPEKWRTVIPEGKETLESVTLAGGQLFAVVLEDASSRVRRYALDGKALGDIDLPGLGSVSEVSGRARDKEVFFDYTSFAQPYTVYHHEIAANKTREFFRPPVAFKPEDYETTRSFVTSKDGTKVPVFVVHRKGVPRDGSNAARLYAYGGFRVSTTPFFWTSNIPWLERGGVFAVAAIRGGGEYGAKWHDDGRLANKQNSFDDFAAAARWLVEQGYTKPERLGIEGASNGGLLVGASITQNPELFGAAVADVGVFDMLRFHKYTIGWAWVPEYGSADDAEQFKYLMAYSPLHNVKPGTKYPALLIVTGDHDDRVVPAHSYKFAATIQPAQAGDRPILLDVDTKAGHGGGKPTSKVIDERAKYLAFFARELGLGEHTP